MSKILGIGRDSAIHCEGLGAAVCAKEKEREEQEQEEKEQEKRYLLEMLSPDLAI